MSSGVGVVVNWRRGLLVFLGPLSKCSWRLSNILFITLHPVTFVSIYDSTFLEDGIFVLGSQKEVYDGLASSKVHLYPMFTASFLYIITLPFGIRNNHLRSLVVCSIASRVVGAYFVVVLDWNSDLQLYSVESPCWVLASLQDFVQTFFFFLQELRAGTNSSGPVVSGTIHNALGWYCVVAVPQQIQVSVGGLSVDCCIETAIMQRDDQDVQEEHGTTCPGVISSELNTLVYRIEYALECCFCVLIWWLQRCHLHIFSTQRGQGDVLRALISKSSIYKFATMGLKGEPMLGTTSLQDFVQTFLFGSSF